jgi:hypothetical protein
LKEGLNLEKCNLERLTEYINESKVGVADILEDISNYYSEEITTSEAEIDDLKNTNFSANEMKEILNEKHQKIDKVREKLTFINGLKFLIN